LDVESEIVLAIESDRMTRHQRKLCWVFLSLVDIRPLAKVFLCVLFWSVFAPLRETKKYLCYYSNWKFLKLIGQVVEIDLGEHYISDIGKILGILSNILTEEVF
jgi:hypothetical protein